MPDLYAKWRSRLGRLFTVGEMARAYRLTFRSPPGTNYVLPDLAEFCHAAEPAPVKGDPYQLGRWAGRQDVWLRIQRHLNLTEEELFAVYAGKSILKSEDFRS